MADIITVSALNRYVRSILESDPALEDIAIRGEISNFIRNAKTGHCYFSLKDAKASVRCVLFNTDAQRLPFAPENGLQVVIRGRVSLYERDGQFQLVAEFMFPDGEGALQAAFNKLKERLEAQGLFDPDLKQMLPAWPKKIGVVTSKTGAVLQDILNVAQRRYPFATIVLAAANVQGDAAVGEVSAAVHALDALEDVEVIIVARGGGSAEDLWVFNDERLARAVFECATPVVSAIGHETDFTILDFVADVRAPTPSAAAELCTPDVASAWAGMLQKYSNFSNIMQLTINSWYNQLTILRGRTLADNVRRGVTARGERLSGLAARLAQAQKQRLDASKQRFSLAAGQAAGLNPYAVLSRGYAVAQREGQTVTSVRALKPGDTLVLTLKDGRAGCIVNDIMETPQESHG